MKKNWEIIADVIKKSMRIGFEKGINVVLDKQGGYEHFDDDTINKLFKDLWNEQMKLK